MTKTKILLTGAAFCAATVVSGTASAMPAAGLDAAASQLADVQQVRWVC